MFIRKWRYLQNLENARSEGRQEGLREANERRYAYTTYLEELNKELQDELADAVAEIDRLKEPNTCCELGGAQKEQQEETTVVCPFVEEPAAESHVDGIACGENTDPCEGCPGWCPELAGTTACPEYGHAVPETADEEAPF